MPTQSKSTTTSLGNLNRWFVVASRTRTRIYQQFGNLGTLKLIETLENPDGRARGREMHRHNAGTGVAKAKIGTARTYTMASHSDPHEIIAEQFAKKVAGFLDKKIQKGAFDRLVLVAEPRVLGLIKKELSVKTSDSLAKSIRKDLDKVAEHQLAKHLGLKPAARLTASKR